MNYRHGLLIVALWMWAGGFPAYAQTAQTIHDRIRQTDRRMANGSLLLKKTTTDPTELALARSPAHLDLLWVYNRKGRFRRRVVPLSGCSQPSPWEELSDKSAGTQVSQETGRFALAPRPAREQISEYRMVGLAPGPCFALGRGLSFLRQTRVQRSGRGWHLTGKAPDRSSVVAELDVRHGVVATRIERRRDGQLIGRWRLGKPIRADRGVWIASQAVFEMYSEGELLFRDEYVLVQAHFRPPAPAAFRPEIPADAIVYDARSGKTTIPPSRKPLPVGTIAPDFQVEDSAGRAVRLSDFHGKVVVLDFWATWCGPCQQSLPHMEEIAQRYADRNVVVLAVNAWDTREAFEKWLPQHPEYRTIRFVIAPGDSSQEIARKRYHVEGIPAQYLIAPDGKILHCCVGFIGSTTELEAAIQSSLVLRFSKAASSKYWSALARSISSIGENLDNDTPLSLDAVSPPAVFRDGKGGSALPTGKRQGQGSTAAL
ncbi:MAG TPA: TlpA disulfide reductase family protein [Chthonomonadaceae bacterium]|nr:TlpA disulfide reductase family protein [Chthonomonadaceae bacterium]